MVLCAVPGGSCFSMVSVRQVARRDAAGSARCSPEDASRPPWRQLPLDDALRQDARPDAAGSEGCSPRRCLTLRCGVASRWCFAASLAVAASRCCRSGFRRESPTHRLPRSGNLFRTDFRFAPSPRSASLAGPPIHEEHGHPRSVRKSSRLRWKHHLPSCSCSPGQATASSGPGAPDC